MRTFWIALISIAAAGAASREVRAVVDDSHPGAALYAKQCAECHGKTGEGTPGEFDDPLFGDRSIPSLARLIEKTMPEEEPKTCVGDDAKVVAEYIYHAFYSPEARARLGREGVAKVDLSRLTVPQYRNAVADLIGSFDRDPPKGITTGGLRGFYFPSKGMNKKVGQPKERVDARMDFDFGSGGPMEGIGGEQFSIVWEGSLLARESGVYEFRVSTPNGARLYVNADIREGERNYRDDSSAKGKSALIDSWVSSGDEVRVETAKVTLLGGRVYPIRLDYFKYKEKRGAVRLEWKPPHGTWEVMSGGDLASVHSPRTFVVVAPFPADDRSLGYERGTAVSKEWHRATTAGAIEVANEVAERIESIARVGEKDPERDRKLKEFAGRFAEAAFRRPLTDAERKLFVDVAFAGTKSPDVGVKRCVLLCLKSPRFLYPDLSPGDTFPDGYTIASRLSFALWDSIPDKELLKEAASGRLADPGHVAKQARRMLADPRAQEKMRGFFEHWLEMGERDLAKDQKLYPGFNDQTVADLRRSLQMFIDGVVWGEKSDYRELLLADYLMLNGRLAKVYGVGDPAAKDFQRVAVDAARRSGVLTHPYLLSAFAYHNTTSPIHRGVFLTRNIVGRGLKPPPMAVAFKDDEFDPGLTMREKVTQLTRDAACMSCHSVINPLGFSLENFDAVGRWQTRDKNKPVNTKSDYTTLAGETIQLTSARDIANYAASNPRAHSSFVGALFHHSSKQAAAAYGKGTLHRLQENFVDRSFNIRELLAEIAVTHAMRGTQTKAAASATQPTSNPS